MGASSGGGFTLSGGFWGGAGGGGCAAITVNPPALPNGQIGQPYSQQLSQSGGAGAITWSLSVGALPNNVTLNAATGLLSGTPTASGTFNFTARATAADNCFGERAYTLVIGNCPVITITPGSLPVGTAGAAYNQQLTATGGTPSYTFSLSAGALPGGLSLSASGLISGMPATPGAFNFTVLATDVNGCTGTQAYSLTINPSGGVAGLQYYPLPRPIRLFDTRAPIPGFPACEYLDQPLVAGGELVKQARVTCDGITIPATAQAIVGNATIINPSGGGFATLWPDGQPRPPVSNLNYVAGQVVPNAFTVGLGSDGQFRTYSFAATHFIVDVTGFFAP